MTKSQKILVLSSLWCKMGHLLPSCLNTAKLSLEGVVILIWLYAVNSEEVSEVVVGDENE